MSDKKLEALKGFLDRLPPREAAALARRLELQRTLGQETVPAESILASLRQQLRVAQPFRTPTLRRLVSSGFEDFLVNRQDATRMPGLIPHVSIEPWWQALQALAPAEIKAYETELARHAAAQDWAAIERFSAVVQRAACVWTAATLAVPSDQKHADPALRRVLRDPGLQTDFAEIARLLAIADPLRQALEAVSTTAARLGQTRGRRILEFSDDTISEAKQQYLRFTDAHGTDARYVALGIMNRLERPWQILRLGRALSWKPDDAMMQDTELAILGQRLTHDLAVLASEIDALMPSPDKAGTDATDFKQMQQALTRYIDNAEQMLGEFGFRRDSAWGEQILATRGTLANALAANRLAQVAEIALAVLPLDRGISARRLGNQNPDLQAVPSGETVEQAVRAARFLMLLLQRGARHGLSSLALSAIDTVGTAIVNRGNRLFDLLAREPSHAAAIAQLNGAIRIAGVLFDDGRADLMSRRLKSALRGGGPG
jgi:hypothetical protein